MIVRFKQMCLALAALTFVLVFSPITSTASAEIVAKVDLSQQRMRVYINGKRKFTWKVSTGRRGWRTPTGSYTPFAMRPYFYSNIWKMALTHVISVDNTGVAIHGTHATSKLGRPASHGCIRLSKGNAARFYKLVQSHGLWNTQVVITR